MKTTVRIELTDSDAELLKNYMEINGWKTYVDAVINIVVDTVRMYDEHREEYEKLQTAIGSPTAAEIKAFKAEIDGVRAQ